ncbi:unnamed protein product [Heligmosomoides polygyrus]|uniref:Mitochondrial 2-oxoglutarate/malate carrier protein n=1 Tax=Heligmosomoides polygyrus TaxID=6339 RepID=A0A183G7S5_HELPZ|nr:unnamed protein product [Heligmosomoides polygyrus]
MLANPRVVIHLLTLKCGSPLDAVPSRDEMKLAKRIASILQDFELRQLEIDEVEKLEVVEEEDHTKRAGTDGITRMDGSRHSVRFGVTPIADKMHGACLRKDQPLSFTRKILLGMMAGACGAAVGSPADLVLIRMTGDGHLPPDHRRNYKNVIDALIRIIKEEGPLALYRGCAPTVARSVVSNGAQLATYTQGKQMILTAGILSDGIFCHFVASSISGLVTTVVALPVDTIKTRIQAMKIIKGKPEHSGILDVCVKIIQNEGFFSFWKGFTPFFMRQAPHTVLMLVFLEQFNRAYLRIFSSHATT